VAIDIPWDLDCCGGHRTVLSLFLLDPSCEVEARHTVLGLSAVFREDVDSLDVGTEAGFHFKLAKLRVQI
jgi:hypothetical protein